MDFLVYSFVIWRILLFLVAFFGSLFLRFTPTFPYSESLLTPSGLPSWIWSFANFDGVHYLTIAKSGYSAQFTQVFFPLYPLVIKFFSTILPFINPILIGLLVSNVAFLISLIIFKRLLLIDYPQKKINWIIIFLLLFPTSFFFGSFYTEGIFFLFLISSFYAARRKRWWLSGLFGSLASATRLVGIFLLPALLWEWHQEKFEAGDKNLRPKNFLSQVLHFTLDTLHSPILYFVPLGLLSYILYLQFKFGDWLYFWHAQPIFGAARSGTAIILLPQVIFRYLKILFTVNYKSYSFWVSLSEFTFACLALILLVKAHFDKVRLSYLIFSWLSILTPTLSGTFSSMPRYVVIGFPIFIALGLIRSKIIKILLLSISFLLLSLFTIYFTRGNWVS